MSVGLDGQAGDLLQAGQTGGPQPALSGHQLPPALPAADGEGLEEPQLPDGGGQFLQIGLEKDPPGLAGVGVDGVYGQEQDAPGVEQTSFL